MWIFVVTISGKETEWYNSSMTYNFIRNYLSGWKKNYYFLRIVKEMGDFCSAVFSNYIWVYIWMFVTEISLVEKNNTWNWCWLRLYCCNLWDQLIAPDLVSVRIYNIFYIAICKMEANNLISWPFSVLFSFRIQKYTNYT